MTGVADMCEARSGNAGLRAGSGVEAGVRPGAPEREDLKCERREMNGMAVLDGAVHRSR